MCISTSGGDLFADYSLLFSDSVDSGAGRGTGHQAYQIREPAVTYWVNRWEAPAMGGDPPSLPPGGDLENLDHVTAARAIVKYKINIFSYYHPLTRILAPTVHA